MKTNAVTRIGMSTLSLEEVQLVNRYIGTIEVYLKGRSNPIEVKGVTAEEIARFEKDWEAYLSRPEQGQKSTG